jgi:hypothetical protein
VPRDAASACPVGCRCSWREEVVEELLGGAARRGGTAATGARRCRGGHDGRGRRRGRTTAHSALKHLPDGLAEVEPLPELLGVELGGAELEGVPEFVPLGLEADLPLPLCLPLPDLLFREPACFLLALIAFWTMAAVSRLALVLGPLSPGGDPPGSGTGALGSEGSVSLTAGWLGPSQE